jgi:hypothetical protein
MKKKMTIKQISEETIGAYSFDRYGQSGWNGAIRVLKSKGMNDLEIQAFLRSKHMRWAADSDDKRTYGHFNGQTVKEYIENTRNRIDQAELDLLVRGTFEGL